MKAGKTTLTLRPLKLAQLPCAFNAEHPVAGLPAITDLATNGAAARIMATLGGEEDAEPASLKSQHLWLEPQPPFTPA